MKIENCGLCLENLMDNLWPCSHLPVNNLSAGVSPTSRLSAQLQVSAARLTSEVSTSEKKNRQSIGNFKNLKQKLSYLVFKTLFRARLATKRRNLSYLIKSSVVDSLLNPRAIKISSVVLCRRIPIPGWPLGWKCQSELLLFYLLALKELNFEI